MISFTDGSSVIAQSPIVTWTYLDTSLVVPVTLVATGICLAWYLVKAAVALSLALAARRSPDRAAVERAVRTAPPGMRRLVQRLAGVALAGAVLSPGLAHAGPSTPADVPVLDRVPVYAAPAEPAPQPTTAPGGRKPQTTAAPPDLDRSGVAGRPRGTPAADPPSTRRTHTVVPGDTLWAIAELQYGTSDPMRTAALVVRIHEANRATIGPDPDLIKPGAVLVLPR